MSNELAIVPGASMIPTTIDEAIHFANLMAKGNLIPAHLKNPADCLRVVLQAQRWQMDPFAVADKTSVIGSRLMYEGQLVSAVVNSRGKMKQRLRYTYHGEGEARVLTVSGMLEGEDEARTIELPFTLARKINKNGQMQINPDQQAAYIGARIWARRHTPELMLGIYTPDEDTGEEPINVTPGAESNRDKAPQRENAPPADGEPAASEKPKRGPGRPAKNAAPVIDVPTTPPAPAAPAQVDQTAPKITTLKDQERFAAVCTIKSLACDLVKSGGQDHPSVVAELSGPFEGKVYHLGGAQMVNDKLVAVAGWGDGKKPVEVTLVGRARKDPTKPCTIFVESVKVHEPVATTAPAQQETASDVD